MATNFTSRLTSLLRSAQSSLSQAEKSLSPQSTPSAALCGPLLGLQSIALPLATVSSFKSAPGSTVPEFTQMYDKEAYRARRLGVVGLNRPVSAELSPPVRASAPRPTEPGDVDSDSDAEIARTLRTLEGTDIKHLLQAASAGTSKLRRMTRPQRDHIMKMLEANDVPGLEAVTSDGNGPLRSYVTALTIPQVMLKKYGADYFSPTLREALENLKAFCEANPALIALGDQGAFSFEKPRSKEEVERLRMAFSRGDELLAALEKAHEAGG